MTRLACDVRAIRPSGHGVRCALVAAFLVSFSERVHAQSIDPSSRAGVGHVVSIGQPPQWQPYAVALGVTGGRLFSGVAAAAGVRRWILNPVPGLLAASGEANADWSDDRFAPGVRMSLTSPAVGLSVGVDWRSSSGHVDGVVSFETAIRRGGLLGGGSMLRVDWLPARDHSIALGVRMPVAQPFAGRTRPRETHVHLPSGHQRRPRGEPSPPIAQAMMTVAQTAHLLRAYSNLYTSDDRQVLDAGTRHQRTRRYAGAMTAYHAAVAAAFRLAIGDSVVGDRVTVRAREVLLEDVVIPYDALFGQVKSPAGIDGLGATAQAHFVRWLADSSGLGADARARASTVLADWLGIVADVQHALLREWKDSRLVWLPLQLALSPDQFDEQAEVDALIARVAGHAFTDDNAASYLRTADLPLEIARSILAARRYHVLWTHDFVGRRENGALDEVSFTMVADAYLPALTRAVAEYDSTGTMPTYVIALDAFYYHEHHGKLWMDILENPLTVQPRFRNTEAVQAARVRERLAALRTAVARSNRLQREAAEHGARWLRDLVKVQVNIMQPSDFSFRSARIAPPLPFVADNVMRDHRKIVFYDFTEARPFDGVLLVTGVGIGEQFASVTWEDRGYRIRGPAALEARAALRRALFANGLHEDQLPEALQFATRSLATADERVARRDFARVLHVHNETGFGTKAASVARAMLYSLAPPGSVIVVPDPLWLSPTWAAMLAGAAARGSTVAIIAPALANAPSPESPVIALERDVLQRVLSLSEYISHRDGEDGGALHVGVYASIVPVTDIAARRDEVRTGLRRAPWIRQVIPFDTQAISVLDRATEAATARDASRPALGQDEGSRAPQQHQKTQFIARPGAIERLVRLRGWDEVLARALRLQAEATVRLTDAIGTGRDVVDSAAVNAAETAMDRYERALSTDDRRRIDFYFVVGSLNHDPRGLMLDGEATAIVSGFPASAGLVDVFYLMARTTWIQTTAQIDALLPPPHGLIAQLARWIRDVF